MKFFINFLTSILLFSFRINFYIKRYIIFETYLHKIPQACFSFEIFILETCILYNTVEFEFNIFCLIKNYRERKTFNIHYQNGHLRI